MPHTNPLRREVETRPRFRDRSPSGSAYAAARALSVYGPVGVLLLLSRLPGIRRHVVVTVPTRQDTTRELWGRSGFLFLFALAFEILYMITIFARGNLYPGYAISRPYSFFLEEVLAGLLLVGILAPAGPFVASRLRLRITDSLEFPLLWPAVLLLVVGGTSVLLAVLLPRLVFDPALFFLSVLLHAPAAWFVALGFSRSENLAQERFIRMAWRWRSARFHFGRLRVSEEPEGVTIDVWRDPPGE